MPFSERLPMSRRGTSVQSAQTSHPAGGKFRWRVPSTSSGPARSRPVRTIAATTRCPDFSIVGTSAPGGGRDLPLLPLPPKGCQRQWGSQRDESNDTFSWIATLDDSELKDYPLGTSSSVRAGGLRFIRDRSAIQTIGYSAAVHWCGILRCVSATDSVEDQIRKLCALAIAARLSRRGAYSFRSTVPDSRPCDSR